MLEPRLLLSADLAPAPVEQAPSELGPTIFQHSLISRSLLFDEAFEAQRRGEAEPLRDSAAGFTPRGGGPAVLGLFRGVHTDAPASTSQGAAGDVFADQRQNAAAQRDPIVGENVAQDLLDLNLQTLPGVEAQSGSHDSSLLQGDLADQLFGGLEEHDHEGGNKRNRKAAKGGPDLVVVDISAPETAAASERIDLAWTVRNQGKGAAGDNGWHDYVYFSYDQTLDESDLFVTSRFTRGDVPLAQDSQYTFSRIATLPASVAADGHLLFVTDRWDRLIEKDDANNVVVSPLDVEGVGPPAPGDPTTEVNPVETTAGGGVLVDAPIDAAQQQALLDGLAGLVSLGTNLNDFDLLAQGLPLLLDAEGAALTIGSALDFGARLDAALQTPIANYFAADATPTTAELVSALSPLLSSIAGGFETTASGDEIRFDIIHSETTTLPSVSISLGDEGDALDLSVVQDASATASVDATLNLDISIGVDLTPGLPADDAFFLRVNDISASAEVSATSLNFLLDVGFLDAGVANGAITLDTGVDVALANPDADAQGNITLGEIAGTSLGGLVALSPLTQTLSGNLPVTASISGVGIPGSPALVLDDPMVFDATPPTITPMGFDELFQFTNLDEFDLLGVLGQLASSLTDLSRSSILDTPLPFAQNTSVGDVLDLGAAFVEQVIDPLSTAGAPAFDSAQTLADALAAALGAGAAVGSTRALINHSYNASANDLTYTIEFTHNFDASTAPIDLSQSLGALGGISVTSGAGVTLDGQAMAQLTFGVNIAPLMMDEAIADRLFIRNASVSGSATVAIESLTASATFGFIEMGVGDASGSLTANASLTLKNPTSGSTSAKITLPEILDALAGDPTTLANVNISGSGMASLSDLSVSGLPVSFGPDPRIDINVPDIKNLSTASATPNADAAQLLDFEDLTVDDIFEVLDETLAFLQSMAGSFNALSAPLPLLDVSLADLIGYVDDVADFIADFKNNPASSLQGLQAALQSSLESIFGASPVALRGPPTRAAPTVNVALDGAGAGILIDLAFDASFSDPDIPLNLDIAKLIADGGLSVPGLDGVGKLIDVSSMGQLSVSAGVAATLNLGVDLTNPANPSPFIVETSNLALTAEVTGSSLGFSAAVGPLGVFIAGGSATLDNGMGAPASFAITLDDTPDDRYTIPGEVSLGIVSASLDAEVHANLPVFFPTASNPFGAITVDIADLSNPSTIMVAGPDLASEFASLDLLSNLNVLLDGLDFVLGGFQDILDGEVFGKRTPVIGDGLAGLANFIETLRSTVIAELQSLLTTLSLSSVRGAFLDALGPSGLDLLQDIAGSGGPAPDGMVDIEDVFTVSADTNSDMVDDEIIFHLRLADALSLLSSSVAFDIGLDALGLEVDGMVEVMLGWDLFLAVGVSRTQGVFFDTALSQFPGSPSGPELSVNIEASVPGLAATGNLLFLQLNVADNAVDPTTFIAAFNADLLDPSGSDDRLTFADFSSGTPLSSIIDADLVGDADVDLDLTVSFAGSVDFPSLTTTFVLDWMFSAGDGLSGQLPSAAFNDVRLNLGEFFSKFVAPIVERIDTVLGPVQPVLDVLTARLPVISDLAGSTVTLLDLVDLFSSNASLEFIDAVVEILDLVDTFSSFLDDLQTSGGEVFIDIGDITLSESTSPLRAPIDLRTLGSISSLDPATLQRFEDDPFAQTGAQVPGFTSAVGGISGGGLEFPIIQNPLSGFGLLLGRDVDLFKWTTPRLFFTFTYSQFFPIVGPLGARFTGQLGAEAQFRFAFDTFGFRKFAEGGSPSDIVKGFHLDDLDENGVDVPEFRLFGSISAGVEVNVVVASAGVNGGVLASFEGNLNDPNGDGDVRLNEIQQNLSPLPFCIFDYTGRVNAFLNAFIKVGICPFCKKWRFNLANVTLVEFNINCNQPPPVLATLQGDGTLVLNMGPRAGDRVNGDLTDGDEEFNVRRVGQQMLVEAFGESQFYGPDGDPGNGVEPAITSVFAEGGAGNDVIFLDGSVDVPAVLYGDFMSGGSFGNDELVGGAAANEIHGGGGADMIFGGIAGDMLLGDAGDDDIDAGGGNDVVNGGSGDDFILGGVGADMLFGGIGDDTLEGESDNDTLRGEAGLDTLRGGDGIDDLDGGDDNDALFGDDGDDLLVGGLGNDEIQGGLGADDIFGNAGDDILYGHLNPAPQPGVNPDPDDAASDLIFGGADNDFINGGAGDDLLFGEEQGGGGVQTGIGNDDIFGEDGDDLIRGGLGDDHIDGGAGVDNILGDDINLAPSVGGADTIFGGSGADIIAGQAGNDTIDGGSGSDLITGALGDDNIKGGSGDDTIAGNEGADTIRGMEGVDDINGGTGADLIFGDASEDLIDGGLGDDTILGGTENDEIFGRENNDSIFAGDGDDFVRGETGDDLIRGNNGNDVIFADEGADTIFGDAGVDEIIGGIGNDEIHGGSEDDLLNGGDGVDTIFGDLGADVILAGLGDDNITGGTGVDGDGDLGDLIRAGAGNDIVNGGDGDDVAFGEAGDDDLDGQRGNDHLDGGWGVDMIAGGDDDDVLIAGDGVGDTLMGGDGNDSLFGSDQGADDPDFTDGIRFGDVLDGGAGADEIFGLGGGDLIMGGPGDDLIDGGMHADSIMGDGGNDEIYAGIGGDGDTIDAGAGDDTVFGSHEGADTIIGGDGIDQIFAQNGDDLVMGGPDDDFIDAGPGTDTVFGEAGNDELLGGGGAGDMLDGGAGDDIIRGSNDGGDEIHGGDGADIIFANAGNDMIFSGLGDDQVDGGLGDDTIEGGAGADLLVGGGDHDILRGHSASGAGDDSAVDTLFGDFGDGVDQPRSGGDQLFGGGGNDLLFGEGADDAINPGAGASDLVDFGSGEGAIPGDFVPPAPTPAPALDPVGVGVSLATQHIPSGPDGAGRFVQLAGSATGPGVSGDRNLSIEPAVAADPAGGQFVAWVDGRDGNFEVYLLHRALDGSWEELAGSATRGGVSQTLTSSRRPSITLDASGNPVVAWTEFDASGASDIRAARFDPAANAGAGAWVALGSSLGAGGISATGAADNPVILTAISGLAVAYLDRSSGVRQVRAKRFDGASWVELGTGGASGGGVTGSASDIDDFDFATDGTDFAIAWEQTVAATTQLYLRRLAGGAGAWTGVAGSDAGGGVSDTTGRSGDPTLAFHAGDIFAAWADETTQRAQIYARRFDGANWVEAGFAAASGDGISGQTLGQSTAPILRAGGGELRVLWRDEGPTKSATDESSLYSKRWSGASFTEEIPGDATDRGVSITGGAADEPALAIDSAGRQYLVWEDVASAPEILLRANETLLGALFTANAGQSVQAILDANALGAGDVIVLASGYTDPGFTVGAADSGVHVIGAPDGSSSVDGAVNVNAAAAIIERLTILNGGASFTGALGAQLIDATLNGANATIDGGSNVRIAHSTINAPSVGVTILNGADAAAIEDTTINASTGVLIDAGGATSLRIIRATIDGTATGVDIANPADGHIADSDLTAGGEALRINADFGGLIESNAIHDSNVGVRYSAAATLSANDIFSNNTGVLADAADPAEQLGFVGAAEPNQIHDNSLGVSLTGQMQGQHVFDNTVGVAGSGVLGGDSLDTANLIEGNATGVDFVGEVRFNRIARNDVGVDAGNGLLIHHNLIYRNTSIAVHVNGASRVQIINNTLVAPAGDNLRVEAGASEVEAFNNVFVAQTGYNIFVANDSQSGYFSDFNNLYTTGAGRVGFWTKDFLDVLDWQADIGRFDLNSIGATVVNPRFAEPRFANAALDDFTLIEPVAGLRSSNPSVDAAALDVELASPPAQQNLLANAGFESALTGWTTNLGAAATGSFAAGVPAPFEGAAFFFAGTDDAGFAQQSIDLLAAGFTAGQLDGNDLRVAFGGRVRVFDQTPRDRGEITLTFLDGVGGQISETILDAAETVDRWELLADVARIPTGARQAVFRFDAVRVNGANNDAYFDNAFLSVLDESFGADMGADGRTDADFAKPSATRIALRSPDLYLDWELNQPRTIRWDTFGSAADFPVRIDLYQDTPDGPEFVLNIAAAAPDTGQFIWIPATSGLTFGTFGLRVQVSLVGREEASDRSQESFAIPEDGANFFVDDASDASDEFTPGATGDNRNTGKAATAPKPNPVNILRTYELASGDTLSIDTGVYPLIDTVTLSGLADVGFGNDRGFTMRGPADSAKIAEFITAIPGDATQDLIDLADADFMTIRDLTLSGGRTALRVRSGTTDLVAERLIAQNNAEHGVLIQGSSSFTALRDITATNHPGNFDGVRIDGGAGGLIENLTASGNRFGVFITSANNVDITGAELFNNRTAGIRQDGGTTGFWTDLNVHDNPVGSDTDGTITIDNSVFANNANIGIDQGFGSATIQSSEIFGSDTGVELTFNSTILDSSIHDNATFGVRAFREATLIGNTIFNNNEGFVTTGFTSGTTVRNNVFHHNAQTAIRLLNNGQSSSLSFDIVSNSIFQPTGDAIRATNTRNVHLRNNIIVAQAGYGVFIANDSQIGFSSEFNLLFATGTGLVGFWQGDRETFAEWRAATFQDQESVSADPLFADAVSGDLHVQSEFGRFDPATETFVLDAQTSPALDRGDPADDFSAETAPNGGFINLGAFGGTAEASRSPAQYILITRPAGGERIPQETTFEIRWRSDGFAGDVRLEFSFSGATGPFQLLADNEPNDGSFDWVIDGTFPLSEQYAIRITSVDEPGVSDITDGLFSVTEPISVFFVNDADQTGDEYTTAPGDDANDGLTAATPKASVRAIIESFDLEFGDVILVDTGVYTVATNIVIDHADSGVTIQGPIQPGHAALLDRGNTGSGQRVFQLIDADAVTISDLEITGADEGVRVGSGSTQFTLQNSRIFNNNSFGLIISDAASRDAIITDNVFFGDAPNASIDQPTGAQISGASPTVLRNEAFHINGRDSNGIILSNAGTGAIVRDNIVYNNSSTGLQVQASSFEATGNIARDNGTGITFNDTSASSPSRSFDNLAFRNSTGFRMDGTGEHFNNTARDNGTGFFTNVGFSGELHDVAAFHNALGVDFASQSGSSLRDSHIYLNNTGVEISRGDLSVLNNRIHTNTGVGLLIHPFFGTSQFANNLIYNNAGDAVRFQNTSNATMLFVNNTVVASGVDAIRLTSNTSNVQLRNNIIQTDGAGAFAINVDNNSQSGFASDYNLIHATGGAQLGFFQRAFATLADWRLELGFDQHSIIGDPLFVDPDGGDNILGATTTQGLLFEGFDNLTLTGPPAVTQVETGAINFATGGGFRGLPNDNQSFRWSGQVLLEATGDYTFFIFSAGPQRLTVDGMTIIDDFAMPSGAEQSGVFAATATGWVDIVYEVVDDGSTTEGELEWIRANAAGAREFIGPAHLRTGPESTSDGSDDDFHLQSSNGSFHGGLWSPDATDSPAIDAGDPADLVFEDSPAGLAGPLAAQDGDRVNLGAFGNTDEASRSPASLIQLLSPNGFEKTRVGDAVVIEWRSLATSGFVDVELSLDGGMTFTTLASGVLDDGDFGWNPTAAQQTLDAIIRVTDALDSAIGDESDNAFSVAPVTNTFFVNDASTAGDVFTTAVGDNANTGTDPASPMASIGALLSAYDLDAGDIIFVDAGVYDLAVQIDINAQDAGITIQGPMGWTPDLGAADPAAAVINRGNNATNVINVNGADDVTIRNVAITGGFHGVRASDADNLVVEFVLGFENDESGVRVLSDSDNARIADSEFFGDASNAGRDQRVNVFVNGRDAVIERVKAHHINGRDQFGIFVDTAGGATLIDNEVFENSSVGMEVHADGQIIASGNSAHDNSTGFFFDQDSALFTGAIAGNEAFNNSTGFRLSGFVETDALNTSRDNTTGLDLDISFQGEAAQFEVFNNTTGVDVNAQSNSVLRDNLIFSNSGVGVFLRRGDFNVLNNVIHTNDVGVRSTAFFGASRIAGNLIYNNASLGIEFNSSSNHAPLVENNTIHQPATTAIRLIGSTSNATLRNNIIVAGGMGNFAVSVANTAQVGFASDFNLFHFIDGANLALWQAPFSTLIDWTLELGFDRNSLTGDPGFVDPDGVDDILGGANGDDDNFHLASETGSIKEGVFTPDAFTSIAIDRGDLASPLGDEPTPNGGRINLGAFGGTAEASLAPATTIQLLSLTGGQKLRVGQATVIQWRSVGAGPFVDIEFSADGGMTFTSIASNEANDGFFVWSPDTFTLDGRIRISDAADPTVRDTSAAAFTVGEAGDQFFINDDSTANDVFTTAVGSNLNSGTTPGDPMASLNALLAAYDIDPGDTVFVDVGDYVAITNIRVLSDDSGVIIQGPTGWDPDNGAGDPLAAVFDRQNTASGQRVLDIVGATDVTIDRIALTGGEIGALASDADRITITNSLAFENALRGFRVDTATIDATIVSNRAFGTTGSSATDQDTGFFLSGDNMLVADNIAWKVGSQFGDGFLIDNASNLTLVDNLAFNNDDGFQITTTQAEISGNESRGNNRGMFLSDNNGVQRTQLFDNFLHDNDNTGAQLTGSVEAFDNRFDRNDGVGVLLDFGGDGVILRENQVSQNVTGVEAQIGGLVLRNRVFGNSGTGILASRQDTRIEGNRVFGNSVGIETNGFIGGMDIVSNLVYDNANFGIYIHNTATTGSNGVRVVNNTIHHQVGTGLRFENNGDNMQAFNNIILILGGFGVEVIGSTTGMNFDFNNVQVPDPLSASFGRWLGATQADLAAWQGASGLDANSLSVDPLFVDIDGADNLFGWEQPDPGDPFADFGADDNFLLQGGSPMIDAANSEVAPTVDADGLARKDDLGTSNTGFGVFRFYDIGTFEFQGSSADITPPTVVDLLPVGIMDGTLASDVFSVLTVRFSEPLNPVSAESPAFYSLIEAGADGMFDTGDDAPVSISAISFTPGDVDVRLALSSALPSGLYRLTIFSAPGAGVVDLVGNELDGDENGTAGGDFVRSFTLDVDAPTLDSVAPDATTAGPTSIDVIFNENLALDEATVLDAANYTLVRSDNGPVFGDADDVDETGLITGVAYNAATKTATLTLSSPLAEAWHRVTVGPGVRDTAGNALGGGSAQSATIVVDATGPTATLVAPAPGSSPDPIPTFVDIAWSDGFGAGVDAATIGVDDITIAGVAIDSVDDLGGGVFRYHFSGTFASSNVEVSAVAGAVADALGNTNAGGVIGAFFADATPPEVTDFTINGGIANRSNITEITLTFSEDVNIADLIAAGTIDDAIRLFDKSAPATPLSMIDETRFAYDAMSRTVTIDLTTDGFGGSSQTLLANGRYEVRLDTALIADGAGNALADTDGTMDGVLTLDRSTGAATQNFFRLLGDLDGDASVGPGDLLALLAGFGAAGPIADIDGDGTAGPGDLLALLAGFGATLPP